MHRKTILVSLFLLFCCLGQVFAQVESAEEAVDLKTTWSVDRAKPGQQVVLAISVDVADGYHIGNPASLIRSKDKANVQPTRFNLSMSDAADSEVTIGQASFPSPSLKDSSSNSTSHFGGTAIIYIPIAISPKAAIGTLNFKLAATYQVCDDKSCFQPTKSVQNLALEVVPKLTVTTGCPSPALFARWSDRRSTTPAYNPKGKDYKSKNPPIGPPWVRDLATAQRLALKSGRPIFLYSTKTYCPHCVVVESEMLSSQTLSDFYDKAIWLYVYRDFSGSPTDRNAQRITDRYSLSSWPQLWLVNPHDLATIGETGRSVAEFATAISDVKIKPTNNLTAADLLKQFEAELLEFESAPSHAAAKRLIQSDDVVAQLAAVRFFTNKQNLDSVTDQAKRLLSIPNDGLRYEVLKAIANTGAGNVSTEIINLVNAPQRSRNPNVLRSHAISALASCGDSSAIAVIAPHAQGTARNSTTRVAVQAMIKIAANHPDCRKEVIQQLRNAFPPIEQNVNRLVEKHAKMVHSNLVELTGRDVSFPETYNEESRRKLINTWHE